MSDPRPTKAQRRESARLEREAIQRKQAARKRNRWVALIAGIAVGAVLVAVIVILNGNSDGGEVAGSTPPASTLPGVLQTSPPWGNNLTDANARLAALGLPQLSEAAGALHNHIHLWVYVDGQPVEVPAEIGFNQAAGVFSPIHTHDTTGVVHVESADPNFQATLGQFMDVWGVYFTPTCIGDLCNDGDKQLRVFVNGKEFKGDPSQVPLDDLSAVVITYGTEDQVPDPMPDTFDFGA